MSAEGRVYINLIPQSKVTSTFVIGSRLIKIQETYDNKIARYKANKTANSNLLEE